MATTPIKTSGEVAIAIKAMSANVIGSPYLIPDRNGSQ
jgi:hypothetical protein